MSWRLGSGHHPTHWSLSRCVQCGPRLAGITQPGAPPVHVGIEAVGVVARGLFKLAAAEPRNGSETTSAFFGGWHWLSERQDAFPRQNTGVASGASVPDHSETR
ncbi:MAG: hypothetical protein R6U98_28695 [Pirellulaceae bacterium]